MTSYDPAVVAAQELKTARDTDLWSQAAEALRESLSPENRAYIEALMLRGEEESDPWYVIGLYH